MMLEFNIRNQEISRIDNFSPAEKSVEYLIAKFNFKTEDWNGAIKRAIFRNVKSKQEKDTMLENDSCVVPWEVLVGSSEIEVSVHGVIGTEEITTNVATYNLDRTLQGGSATQEPSPTVYEQILKEMQETKDIAQSVRDDANAGVFNGAQGPKGDSGSIDFKIVKELPTENISESTMYLVSLSPSSENNEFAEYIYVNGHWEYIGSATVEVDLSDYVKKDDYATVIIDAKLIDAATENPEFESYASEFPAEAGLYDDNNVLLSSWDELTSAYGLDLTKDKNPASLQGTISSIMKNNSELSGGKKLIIGEGTTTIGSFQFFQSSLTHIKFPTTLTKINSDGLTNAQSLKFVYIPITQKHLECAINFYAGELKFLYEGSLKELEENVTFNANVVTDIKSKMICKYNAEEVAVDILKVGDKEYVPSAYIVMVDDKTDIKNYVDNLVGDIKTSLDAIIAIQESLIGG